MIGIARRVSPIFLCTWFFLMGIFVLFSIVPLGRMLIVALNSGSMFAIFSSTRQWFMLGRTLALSLWVALLAGLFGGAMGYLLGTTSWRGKTIIRVLLVLPLAIPPYFHAVGWTTVLRPNGVVVGFLSAISGVNPAVFSETLYSFHGAVFILVLSYFPIAMLFYEKALSLISPSLEEAARVFGANPWQTFLAARWPFVWPALVSSAMLTFLLATAELGVPTILKVPVFNFEVFIQLGAFNDVTAATLLVLPLLFVGFLVLYLERCSIAKHFVQADVRDVVQAGEVSRSPSYFTRGILVLAAVVALGVPFASVCIDGIHTDAMSSMLKLAWKPALNTLRYSVSASILITVFAFIFAFIMRRVPNILLRITDGILITGFAVPGTILALSLLSLYDRPGISRWVTPVMLVVAAMSVRYLIVGYRIVAGAVAQIPDDIIDVALLDGASGLRSIWHIYLPLLRVAFLITLGISFVLTTGEIGATILLYPPGGETLAILLYSIEANSPHSYISALTLLQFLFLFVPLTAALLLYKGIAVSIRQK
ncbi:MAG: iron ABC transporter permease [Candidatus Hydrogenedentes bacterium]|nr:iron ABC transporter permease [Candidatus Hydrogenedentota bacterium]